MKLFKMNGIQISKKVILMTLFFNVLVGGILVLDWNDRKNLPIRDSGMFLYIGREILHGNIPYRDVWDNKPPGIYYLNALALAISNDDPSIIWIVEYVFLFIGAVIGYLLMRKVCGFTPSILASIVWILSLSPVINGGNYPEEYSIPLIFLTLYLFWHAEKKYSTSIYLFLGILGALLLLLKPNLIGVHLAISMYLVCKILKYRKKVIVFQLMTMGTGFSVTIAICIVYFWLNNAGFSLLNAVVAYNIYYSRHSLLEGITSLAGGYFLLFGIFTTALLAWILAALDLLYGKGQRFFDNPLLTVCLIALPVLLIFGTISGRAYPNYYLAWIPILALLTSYLFTVFVDIKNFPAKRLLFINRLSHFVKPLRIVLLPVLLFTLATQLTYSAYEVIVPQNDNPTRMKVVKFLNEQTTPSDNVLIWGAEATVYVQAGIKAPVQDVLLYHAFTKDFNKTALINQLILDIKTKRPRYIIDASISEPNIPPLDHEKRKLWKAENRNYGIDPPHYSLFAYIEQNYTFRGSFGDKPWVIYERKR